MKIIIGKKLHKIVYIEYQDGVPHDVKTIFHVPNANNGPYWRLVDWDFFLNDKDKKDLRAYESGSGGLATDIKAPQFVDGYTGIIWIDKKIVKRLKGKGANFKIIKHPKRLELYYPEGRFTTNPFKAAEITHSHYYCEECGHEGVEPCEIHDIED